MPPTCRICLETRGVSTADHGAYSALVDDGRHIVIDDQYCVVVPSLGPLNAYHLLIIPKQHYLSVAQLASESEQNGFMSLKHGLSEFNRLKLGLETAFFEHGTGTHCDVACACVEHAHFHAVAMSTDISRMLVNLWGFHEILSSSLFGHADIQRTGYYYYEHTRSTSLLSTRRLDSQFFRRVIAPFSGRHLRWNWRFDFDVPTIENVLASYGPLNDWFDVWRKESQIDTARVSSAYENHSA